MIKKSLLFIIFLLFSNGIINASDDLSAWKISGYVISDFYHITKAESDADPTIKPKEFSKIIPDFEGDNGFQIRRIYLTFSNKISNNVSARVRFEMGNTPYEQTKLEPVVKDAFIKWKICDNHNLSWGIHGTATFGLIEKFWGYRILQKTMIDYYGIRSSRDFGIALTGKLPGKIGYHLSAGNGESNKSEKTGAMSKLYSMALDYSPIKNLVVQVYGDVLVNDDIDNEMTTQIFTGYKSDFFRLGFHLTHQAERLLKSKETGTVDLIAIPVVYQINNNYSVMLQVAQYKVSEIIDYEQNVVIAGIDFKPIKNINIMPNIEMVQYNFDGESTKTDLVSRITVSYKFAKG